MVYHAETQIFRVDPTHPDAEMIARAAAVIRAGGLVAFPTETVYGLGANALDADAVSRIFAAKGRPSSDPLIVHIHAITQLEQVARDVPPLAYELAARFWAGALTLVLRRADAVPSNVAAGGDTVAVRMPSHPVALALLNVADVPIAAPSANLFARPSPTTAQHVLDDLRGRVDIVLDGGATMIGVESTVLDLTQTPPRVLRPGGVPLEALRDLIPDVTHVARYLDVGENAASPGQLLKHYSPRAAMRLYRGEADKTRAALLTAAQELTAQGRRVGVMTVDEERALFESTPARIASLGSLHDLDAVARNLFAVLRDLDAQGVDVILVRALPQEGLGLAVWDRLVRAAEGKIIDCG